MDFFKKIKQKACRMACDHLASAKPARLVFFTAGGEGPSSEDQTAYEAKKQQLEAEQETLEGISPDAETRAEVQATFQTLNTLLDAFWTAPSEEGDEQDFTVTERGQFDTYKDTALEKHNDLLIELARRQVDERIALRGEAVDRAVAEATEPTESPEAASKTPAQHRAELLSSGHIVEVKPEGYLKDMARDNGMTYDQIVELNDLISPNFHVNKAKGWCYADDTVYVYTSPRAAEEAEVALGFREASEHAEFIDDTPETVVTGEALAEAASESYAREQAQAAELYGEKGADVVGTREALLAQKGRGRGRKESFRGTLLSQGAEGMIDPSMRLPLAAQDWNDLKDSWDTVQGRAGIEEWLKRPTFKAAGIDVDEYLQALAKDGTDTVRFQDLLSAVYRGPAQGEGLVLGLAQQLTGLSIDTKEHKKVLRKIKGNFTNDYDRMMDTLTLETTEKTYIGDGMVRVSLESDDQTLTLEVPLEQVVTLDEDALDMPLEDLTDTEIQAMIDDGDDLSFYMSPEGQLMSARGEDVSGAITEGNIENLAAEHQVERAIVMAMETIYQDVSGLYDLTGNLTYVEAQADESYIDTRSRVEALRDSGSEYGPVAANFSTRLGEALADNQWSNRDLESLGFIRKGDEITYEDIESGRKYTIRKEELFKYYSGDAVIDEILDKFLIQEHTDDGSIATTFKLGDAIAFVNNDVIRLGLSQHPEMVEEYGGGDIEAALVALRLRGEQLTEDGQDLSADQMTLIQDGYLIHATMRHASEVQEGRAAAAELSEAAREGQESLQEESTEIRVFLPDEYLEAIYATNPQFDNPKDRALIADRIRIGFHVGTVKIIDDGVTHTRTHVFYDANGNEVDRFDVDRTIREAGTLDATRLASIGVGVNPVNIQGLGENGNQSLSFGFAGGYNFVNQTANIGAGARYTVEFKNGIQVYADAGVSLGGGAVGGGINIPIGQMRLDLHGHAYVGVPGGSVGAMLTLGNIENRYESKVTKKFEKNGFSAIDEAIAAAGQQPSLEVTELILAHEDFSGMGLADIYATFENAGGPSFDEIKNEPGFQQFVMDMYRQQRSARADEILHGIAANPLSPANITIGVEAQIVGGFVCLCPVIGTAVYSQKLAFRSPTGIPYEIQGDDVLLQQLLHTEIDVKTGVLRGQVPKLVRDPENPEDGYVVAMEGEAHEGLLMGAEAVASYNQELRGSGLFLVPTKVRQPGEDGEMIERTLMELSIAEANGSLEIIPDPALADQLAVTYKKGEGGDSDSYLLAFSPGTNLSIRRVNLHYPYEKNGSYERTIIVITEQGSGVTYDQLLDQHAPMLRRSAGKRTISDLAHSTDYLDGEINAPVQTLSRYMDRDPDQMHDWTEISEQDALARDYLNDLGYPGFGEEVSEATLAEFESAARELMDQSNASNKQFRIDFKKFSTIGGNPDPVKLQELCGAKAEELFGRELTPAELTQFIQTLAIFSFVDLHNDASELTGEAREKALKEQQKSYERMLHGYMTQRLTIEFSKHVSNKTQVKQMVELVVSRLEISADEWEMFDPESGGELPTGGVFGSIVGTDRIRGIRLTENYQDQEFYEILKLTPFDLRSSDPVEREVARAIVAILNPLPEETEMTPENVEAAREFLLDDFTQRMVLVWAYKNPEQHQTLSRMSVIAKQNDTNFAEALVYPGHQELLTELQDFVQESREAELSAVPKRIKLRENVYLNFENVEASFFVFQRCGNVSLYLNEDIFIENEAGAVIGVVDERHVMVQAEAAERQLIVGLGVSQKVKHIGDHTSDVVEHHEEPEPEQPDQGGTVEEGGFTPTTVEEGTSSHEEGESGHSDDDPEDSDTSGAPMGGGSS